MIVVVFMFGTVFIPITVFTTTFFIFDGRVTFVTRVEVVIDIGMFTKDSKPVMKPLVRKYFT